MMRIHRTLTQCEYELLKQMVDERYDGKVEMNYENHYLEFWHRADDAPDCTRTMYVYAFINGVIVMLDEINQRKED